MKNLSVFIDDISDKNGFKADLHLGFTNTTKIRFKENEILFQNVDSKQIEIICAHLSKGVLMEFCKKCFVKIINKNCDYFSKYDKYKIWKLSMEHILKDVAEQNYDYLYRENIVRKELEIFFLHSTSLSVIGFINFRLNELESELEEIVEECVQDYLIELEYIEFINMLKYYMALQIPKYLTVDVFYDEEIKIYSGDKNITEECIREFNCGIKNEFNKDDFLLNSLIYISPRKVNIYETDFQLEREIRKTLYGVFDEKINFSIIH